MPDLPTIAHVTLTVSDLDRSVQWYERLFDAEFHRDENPRSLSTGCLARLKSDGRRAS